MIYSEMKSLFFCLIKRTKNQGFGIVVKAQFSVFFNWFWLLGALFCSLLKSLILSVICCAACSKSLAFQLVLKTQQSQGQRWFWIGRYDLSMKIICREFEMIYSEMKSLFFCLIKRTKNQGFGIVVKAQFSVFFNWFSLRGALFCSLLKSLILSVICCAASSKSLAFQIVLKTQLSQGQKGDSELGAMIYKWN